MRLAMAATLMFLLSCTTYHEAGPSGGFSETRLSESSYRVYFRGNTYTSPARVEKLMFRRAAELALENGFRYFVLEGTEDLDRRDLFVNYSQRGVTVRFLADPTPQTADAIIVVEDTDALARGRLSPAAREAMGRLREK